MSEPLLTVKDLVVDFRTELGDVRALDKVSFDVPRDCITAVVGESGSGKTVTGNSIMRLLPESAHVTGEIVLHPRGEEPISISSLAERDPRLRSLRGGLVSMVFQEPMTALSPVHRIGDQVAEAVLCHRRVSRETAWNEAAAMLEQVGLTDIEKRMRMYPFEFSGGMRQRVIIAIALICHPQLLICDEPTTALDVTIQAEILVLIRSLQRKLKNSVLFITHDLGVVAQIADRVVVMYDGQVVETGSVRQVLKNPQHSYTRHLLASMPDAVTDPGSDFPVNRLLSVENLSKSFAGQEVVRSVSFDVDESTTLGIVGESGSGKTTLVRSILRAIDPDSGAVRYNSRDGWRELDRLTPRELLPLRREIQMIFQDPFASLNPRMTVQAILEEPLIIHDLGDRAWRKQRVAEMLRKVQLDPGVASRFPHAFSGGQRQRIGIARALILEPRLVVCDESVSALDVSVQAQILDLLADLQAELGLTYLFVAHDLRVVRDFCDHVLVMYAGSVVEQGPVEEIFANPKHDYTRLLLSAIPLPDPDEKLEPLDRGALNLGAGLGA